MADPILSNRTGTDGHLARHKGDPSEPSARSDPCKGVANPVEKPKLKQFNPESRGHAYTDSGVSFSEAGGASPETETTLHTSQSLDPDNNNNNNAAPRNLKDSPVAICGLGMRLPGGIRNAEDFWDLLIDGRDARGPIPPSRFNADGFADSLGGKGAVQSEFGYFLDHDISRFDTSFFSMSKAEVERCDPQQRLLLEVTRECLEDAGEVDYRGKSIGCYVGTFGEDWLHMVGKDNQHVSGYMMGGSTDFLIANRVSYEHNFRGPSMVVKTGCSASMVALHEACRALQSGDASAAIVAGTNLILSPTTHAFLTAEGVLSPEGSCKTFDASADGYARAEGISAVYVKRLEDAIRDGNPVRAVIRGSGVNDDGKTKGILVPSSSAQEMLIRKVYADSGLDPSDTAYVECHGTGTPVGDPIETTAVGNVFGPEGVYIGSVKANIGHGEGSAGITSLIKATLALEHRIVPPNIKFVTPNPNIPFTEKKLKVPIMPTPFPLDKAERISINSFGVGGANAHVILDSFSQSQYTNPSQEKPELLIFSANTQASLKQQVLLHKEYAAKNPTALENIAFTRAVRRERLPHKAFVVMQGSHVLEASGHVHSTAGTSDGGLGMIFSGQGAQWAGMGRELILHNTDFRRDIEAMDDILLKATHPPRWTIMTELLKPIGTSQINTPELAQPLCTALQIAILHQFLRLGVVPTAVVGHSSGEIAAAYAAGHISLEFAITAAYYRGLVTSNVQTKGAMAAIGLGAEDVATFLPHGVVVACENSPQSTTVSGDQDAVEQLVKSMSTSHPDTFVRILKVDVAYHSPQMFSLAEEYLQLLQQTDVLGMNVLSINPRPMFLSSVTTTTMDDPCAFGPEYWVSNLVSSVRFSSAVTNLLAMTAKSDDMFLEIGPHAALAGPLRQICAAGARPCNYISSQKRGNDCAAALLSALGRLYLENVSIDFEPLFPAGKVVPGLPSYPWDHNGPSFWYESRLSKDWRLRQYPHHCLLGLRSPESPDTSPLWRSVLSLEDNLWLADHKLGLDIVFPFAAYIAMAGEAIRQLTRAPTGSGYRLRHVNVRAALVLNDSKPVELTTALRHKRLTDSDESQWFDFTISSHNGSGWVKHCEGEVLHLADDEGPKLSWTPETLPRKLPSPSFYNAVKHAGYGWGPEFQRLADINAATTGQLAQAKVSSRHSSSTLAFTIHPTALDACLQLLLCATAQGLCRNFDRLRVPTSIEDILVSRSAAEMHIRAWVEDGSLKKNRVECVANNQNVIRMRGIQLTPLDNDTPGEATDVHAAARCVWLPHFDFVDTKTLLRPPNTDRHHMVLNQELTLLCMLEEADKLAELPPCRPHFAKLRDWMSKEIEAARRGEFPLVEDPGRFLLLSPPQRRGLIESHYEVLLQGHRRPFAIAAKRICDHAADIFKGTSDVLEVLKQDDVLADVYTLGGFGYGDLVRLLSHSRPNLRILEVGAGTGGTTDLILRDLAATGGFPPYSTYTFTDVSAGFFAEAKQRFSSAPNMEFKVFDITRSPFDQGFQGQERTYDLILASHVVHATPYIKETLGNLAPLLRTDGMLILTEISPNLRIINYLFGHLAGWWLGEQDNRHHEPHVSVDRWDMELKSAGFTGADTVVLDDEAPYNNTFALVSRLKVDCVLPEKRVTLLCEQGSSGVADTLTSYLEISGWQVTPCQLAATPPAGQNIISCLGLEGMFFDDLTEKSFEEFKAFMGHVSNGQQKVLWLSHPVQFKCNDPRSAQLIGVARSLRSELALPLFTLEMDGKEPSFNGTIVDVFEKIGRQDNDGELAPDMEFVVDGGVVCVPRYHPFSLNDELQGRIRATGKAAGKFGSSAGDTIALQVDKVGSLETLYWRSKLVAATIPADHVEIETRAVGLNYRDILLAMGMLPSKSPVSFGFEVSGIIRRVGSAVRWLAPGDRVAALGQGCLATSVLLQAALVARIPNDMTFESAATVPICFATAIHSLIDVGRLRRGQSVLIHSACGGVGLAAIQVCRMLGVQVYLTVGNTNKVEYLTEQLGVPHEHIFNSRNGSFVEGLMRETSGRGVDLVLNSLSGELLHESWKCVARFGTFVELGKRDIQGAGRLDMLPFLDNRSYHGVDIAQFVSEQPERMSDVLARFFHFHGEGLLQSIQPVAVFEAGKVAQAFRHLQNGDHVGKVVISMSAAEDSESSIEALPQVRCAEFDPHATYMLVGGIGGLGRSVATWIVERGARYIMFLSRSAGISEESKTFFAELESMGCSVTAVAGRVDNIDDVQKAVHLVKRPIKGVFQLAMVLKDTQVMDMDWSQWTDVLAPKVRGTWNLHEALLPHRLDFFWLASSITTAVDRPGQGNYNAGNAFLEAFCQYRHSLGLPASVTNISPISDVGFVAESPYAQRQIKISGLYFLREREFLDFLELSLLEGQPESCVPGDGASALPSAPWSNRSQVLMGLRAVQHLNDPSSKVSWQRNRRMGLYHNLRAEGAVSTNIESNTLKDLLARAVESEGAVLKDTSTVDFLAAETGRKIYDLMLKPEEKVDVGLTLAQIGLDSLMAIELRRWFKVVFGLQLSVLEIMGSGSLRQLAELTTLKLGEKLHGGLHLE